MGTSIGVEVKETKTSNDTVQKTGNRIPANKTNEVRKSNTAVETNAFKPRPALIGQAVVDGTIFHYPYLNKPDVKVARNEVQKEKPKTERQQELKGIYHADTIIEDKQYASPFGLFEHSRQVGEASPAGKSYELQPRIFGLDPAQKSFVPDFYSAYNTKTGNIDYVIGPGNVTEFKAHADDFAREANPVHSRSMDGSVIPLVSGYSKTEELQQLAKNNGHLYERYNLPVPDPENKPGTVVSRIAGKAAKGFVEGFGNDGKPLFLHDAESKQRMKDTGWYNDANRDWSSKDWALAVPRAVYEGADIVSRGTLDVGAGVLRTGLGLYYAGANTLGQTIDEATGGRGKGQMLARDLKAYPESLGGSGSALSGANRSVSVARSASTFIDDAKIAGQLGREKIAGTLEAAKANYQEFQSTAEGISAQGFRLPKKSSAEVSARRAEELAKQHDLPTGEKLPEHHYWNSRTTPDSVTGQQKTELFLQRTDASKTDLYKYNETTGQIEKIPGTKRIDEPVIVADAGSPVDMHGVKIYEPQFQPLSTNPKEKYRFSDPKHRTNTGKDVYLGENSAVSYFEVRKDINGKSLFIGKVKVDNILDLSDPDVLKKMNIDRDLLTMNTFDDPKLKAYVYNYTNKISNQAYDQGYNGILYNSSQKTEGDNKAIILFGDRYNPSEIETIMDTPIVTGAK